MFSLKDTLNTRSHARGYPNKNVPENSQPVYSRSENSNSVIQNTPFTNKSISESVNGSFFKYEKILIRKDKTTIVIKCYPNIERVFAMELKNTREVWSNAPENCTISEININMLYATYTGLSVSVVFLSLHLAAFVFGATSRTLPDRNLASYSLALLMAYICFLVGQHLYGDTCFIVAILTYYFFLVSSLWSLTMSFDVWRSTRLAKTKLRSPSGGRRNTFITFSVWNWASPAIMALFLKYVDTSLLNVVGENFRPHFAETSCWFGEGDALLIYFLIPVTVIMTLNVFFFCSTAYNIYSSKRKETVDNIQYFLISARLTVMMGLSWTIGVIADFVNEQSLWYAFIIFNSLQGFFIFLSFTCKKKIFRALGAKNIKVMTPQATPLARTRPSDQSNRARIITDIW